MLQTVSDQKLNTFEFSFLFLEFIPIQFLAVIRQFRYANNPNFNARTSRKENSPQLQRRVKFENKFARSTRSRNFHQIGMIIIIIIINKL